jgi:hypothetical protein
MSIYACALKKKVFNDHLYINKYRYVHTCTYTSNYLNWYVYKDLPW